MDNSKKEVRSAIAQFMSNNQRYHEPVELALEIDIAVGEVRSMLNKMTRDGEIIEVDGEYSYLNAIADSERPIAKYINSPLTERERSEFALLKNNISKSFYILGSSLGRIRNLRLYREEYSTFEEFCQTEYGYTRRYVNYQILGAEIVEDLKFGNYSSQTRTKILPTAETQIRCLAKLPKQKRIEIWNKAVEKANGVPTEKIVKQVVAEEVIPLEEEDIDILKEERFLCGDIVRINTKGDRELEGFNGAWAQIVSLEEDNTYTVLAWCGASSKQKHKHLTRIELDADTGREFNRKLNRIRLTLEDNKVFDPGLWKLIKAFGTCHESELTRSIDLLLDKAIAELSETKH